MKYRENLRSYWQEWLLVFLIAANAIVWVLTLERKPGNLKVSFLDVGQGDAIFIETPSHRQVLIDGGKNRKVVSELGKQMAFGDRSIDVIIATHPDADHIGGLPEVFSSYKVGLYVEPGAESENSIDDLLRERVAKEGIETLFARGGETIDFGDGAKLMIIFPNSDVTGWETNDASIVARLIYGDRSFLFTGDAGIRTENILMSLAPELMDVDVLKAGHHGSRTSTSLSFAQAASPTYAVISAGKDNTYGHPHKEVLDILKKVGAEIKSTAESGTIIFASDGQSLEME
jgi:competence protein ComEC